MALPLEAERIIRLYGLSQAGLEALVLRWDAEDVDEFIRSVNASVDRLDLETARLVAPLVDRVLTIETKVAERLAKLPALELPQTTRAAMASRFYRTFAQQNQTIRSEVARVIEKGWSRGMSIDDRRALQRAVIDEGIVGLVRADGSRLSVEATGKSLVRTRVNELQNETHLARYRQAGIEEVEFMAGGLCRYKGLGGTCTSLNGRRFPVNQIPSWARIPRHLYSNSRWLPLTNSAK